jgi:U6 snRNA-associated Sm-like protein LSm2
VELKNDLAIEVGLALPP